MPKAFPAPIYWDTYDKLLKIIRRYRSAVIAFSGGVDSTFLAYAAAEALAGKVLLVTARSSTYPRSELAEAKAIARRLGLQHRIIVSEETAVPGFCANPPDRCYYCKKELFSKLKALAQAEEYAVVFDGSNKDDAINDYRPGRKALAELGIVSPLLMAGLTKEKIRAMSRKFGLLTADKPSYACLASRFPYGETITRAGLRRVEEAERRIRTMGFTQVRVRSHGDCARIEFIDEEIENAWKKRAAIERACAKAGFVFTAIDTRGYRMGAMNEALVKRQN